LAGKDLSITRRDLMIVGAASAVTATFARGVSAQTAAAASPTVMPAADIRAVATSPVSFKINGIARDLTADNRLTLLDALREQLAMTGTKKGCDHGQCGACTVMVNGRRINSCLTLAIMHDGDEVTTIEGLGSPDNLDPMQAAFIAHDGYQCGYCTPGQICSAKAVLEEIRAGIPSHVTADITTAIVATDDEIRERMSGNICRCGAYANILAAVRQVEEERA
jgi:xanthine dehydrogenase YagT iron-sulfur-binding subunit